MIFFFCGGNRTQGLAGKGIRGAGSGGTALLPDGSLPHVRLPLPFPPAPPLQRGVGAAAAIARGFKKEIEDAAARRKRQEQLTKK